MQDEPFALPWAEDGWTDEHLDWAEPRNQHVPRRRRSTSGARVLRGHEQVAGPLIGGCLEVLEMLKATPWWPPADAWRGAILFFETSEEAPHPEYVKRWIRNYGSQGILQAANGILLARPANMDEEGQAAQQAAVLAALDEWSLTDLPVIANLDFGHTDPIVTLPYGGTALLDCSTGRIEIRP